MSGRRFAVIDPGCGVSGDMLLGALVDLGAPALWLRALPERLGVADAEVRIDDTLRCGIRATKVTITLGGAIEGPGDVSEHESPPGGHHDHEHEHGHHHHPPAGTHHHADHHHGPHRRVADLIEAIDRAPLSSWVKARATGAFELLAQAEGKIHGVAPADVWLHEVGANDALIDIVGAVEGFEQLGVETIYTRPIALGKGWIRAAHGLLPVPAPATSLLIEGLTIGPDGPVTGEATTPTGAALLRVLTSGSAPAGRWKSVRVGFGAGGRDPHEYPNALKIMLGEPDGAADPELVTVLATDLDDLSPEYLEPLREALVAAGALDVQSWATQMKKGRIGFRIEAVVPPPLADAVVESFFRHSGTAGVRRTTMARDTLPRESWELEAGGERVRIKTLHGPDGPRVKPEYDDVVALARRSGQPAHEVARRLQEEALRQVRPRSDDEGGDNVHEKESAR